MVIRLALAFALVAAPAWADDAPGKTLEILVRPTHDRIVAGEMVPVTIRGVYDSEIALEEMKIAPNPNFDWIQLVPDDWRNEMVDGVRRRVVERRLAIFPKASGIDTFGPVDHVLTAIGARSRREDVTVHAQPVSLAVAPMPDDPPFEKPWGWRFAASNVTITDTLSTDPAKLVDGETVTRTVTLRAEGALPEMLPPRPVVQAPWLIVFTGPVEQELERDADTLASSVTWTWQMRPETGEPGVLPPIPIPYFNTETRKVEAVEIPALPIGYASFEASQVPGGEMRRQVRLAYAGAAMLGLLAGAGACALGVEGGGGWWRRVRRRYSPLPLWRLRRAARWGDPLALRASAEAYLAPGEAPRPAERAAVLARLDTAIYGRAPDGIDTRAFVRDLRAAARRRA